MQTCANQAPKAENAKSIDRMAARQTAPTKRYGVGGGLTRYPQWPVSMAGLQAKLKINRIGDAHEQEADRVADAVVRGGAVNEPLTPAATATAQRKCAACDQEEEEGVQRKESAGNASLPGAASSSGMPAVAGLGGGRPLGNGVRSRMERGIGADFSGVRVHDGVEAAERASALNARAYTAGRDIVFGAGEYRPGTSSGDRLLAHELVHVEQQRQGRVDGVQREEDPEKMGQYTGMSEDEAEEYGQDQNITYEDTGGEAGSELQGRSGTSVKKPGRISREQYLRSTPLPEKQYVTATLPFNTYIFVELVQKGWYWIATSDGRSGWVPADGVALDPPEPGAELYRIQDGDTPIGLVGRWYRPKGGFEWGQDARFYVGALAYANKGRAGMPSASDLGNVDAWRDTQLIAGNTIWKPTPSFLASLKGKVSSGSITKELWEGVKKVALAVWDFVTFGAAFIAGALYGALESLWDLLVGLIDLAKMLWDVLVSIITGNILSDAKELWDNITSIDPKKLFDDFGKKWDAMNVWEKGFLVGRVVGYIIMEIITAILTGGSATAVKWSGKFAKAAKTIEGLGKLSKLAAKTKAAVSIEKILPKLGKAGDRINEALKARRAATASKKMAKIVKAVDDGRPLIKASMGTAEYLTERANAYARYLKKGGRKQSKSVWEKSYDTLYMNREVGKLAEQEFAKIMGGAPKEYKVVVKGKTTVRKVDNVLGDTAREIKSGPLKLTDFIKQQILKDMQLMKTEGLKIEWHLLAGGDPKAIAALQKAGFKVVVY